MRGLWEGERHVGEDVESGGGCVALAARDGRAHLPIEEEVDYGPISKQVVRPLFEAELVQITVFAFRVLDIWLLHS